jgi:hypothetical protein
MSDLFDAPATGAPRAGGVSVAGAASRDRIVRVDRAGAAAGVQSPMGMAPQRPADADPEDEEDDLDDDLDDDEDDEDDDLDDEDDDDEDDDDDLDDEDEDLDDDDLDDDLVDLDDEYDNDDEDDRGPGRADYESD